MIYLAKEVPIKTVMDPKCTCFQQMARTLEHNLFEVGFFKCSHPSLSLYANLLILSLTSSLLENIQNLDLERNFGYF